MSESASKAVFLSYASQDAEAARRICETLRAAGIEVWFDQSELVGGDAWDAKIRKQLQECALFIPMVSANTQARSEGYFRIEWRLAAQRTYAMADDTTFLMPVVIDETRDADARVPAEFKAVQWTRLPRGETTPAFCERAIALLSGQGETGRPRLRRADAAASSTTAAPASAKRKNPQWLTALMVGVPLVVGLFFAWRVLPGKASPPPSSASVGTQPLAAEKPAAVFPRDPELHHAWSLFLNTPNNTTEDFALAEDIVKAAATSHPTDPETVIVYAWLNDTYINRGFDLLASDFDYAHELIADLGADARQAMLRNADLQVCSGFYRMASPAPAVLDRIASQPLRPERAFSGPNPARAAPLRGEKPSD